MEGALGIRSRSAVLVLGLALAAGPVVAAETPEEASRAAGGDFAAKAAEGAGFEFKLRAAGTPPPWDRAISGTEWFGVLDRVRLRIHKSCLRGSIWRRNTLDGGLAQLEGDLFQAAVEEGLHNLETWSPGLVEDVLSRVDGKTVTLTCPKLSPAVGGQFDRVHATIAIRDWDETALWAGAAAGNFVVAPADKAHAPLLHVLGSVMPEVKADLFHEFLHFAGLDNLDSAMHNRLKDSRLNDRQLDRVYSCVGLAFRFGNSFGYPTSRPVALIGAFGYPATVLSCETCLGPNSPDAAKCRTWPQGPSPK